MRRRAPRFKGPWIILGASLLGLLLALALLAPALFRAGAARRLYLGPHAETGEQRLLGRVSEGRLTVLAPRGALSPGSRLTAIPMRAAQSPESAELDLSPYEGQVIVIQGRDSGGWMYEARVASTFEPWPTFLIRWAWLGR